MRGIRTTHDEFMEAYRLRWSEHGDVIRTYREIGEILGKSPGRCWQMALQGWRIVHRDIKPENMP